MRMLLAGAALLAAPATVTAAEFRHDVKLEQAVMEIVAARIGDIRGGFSHEVQPAFVVPRANADRRAISLESARAELMRSFADALVPMAGRNVSRVIAF